VAKDESVKGISVSLRGVPIRLTWERWWHIVRGHVDLGDYQEEVMDTIQNPEEVRQGYGGALIALRGFGRRGYLAVIYKEKRGEGFIITARFTHKKPGGKKRWRRS
jgi:hypothetical protein